MHSPLDIRHVQSIQVPVTPKIRENPAYAINYYLQGMLNSDTQELVHKNLQATLNSDTQYMCFKYNSLNRSFIYLWLYGSSQFLI